MPDLDAMLLRKCVCSLDSGRQRCSACDRTPLVGERLHDTQRGRTLCDLCLAALPSDERGAVSSRRVQSSERRLAVVPRAA